MVDSKRATADSDVPEAVTFREVQEIIRSFRDSGWNGMTLELHGMRVVIGKIGPPASARTPARATTAFGTASATPVGPASASATGPAPAGAPATPASAAPTARSTPPPTAAPAGGPDSGSSDGGSTQSPPPVDTAACLAVRSPAVGSFWVAPSPGQPPFVQVGRAVTEDDQLGIVEVMKLMNPVLSPAAGQVVQVCAANAELVEYEQVLFWIRPSDG